jgi:integrase/recombinase XerD
LYVAGDEWQTWFESWRLTLEVRGRRPRTIDFYQRELARFGAHVAAPPLLVTKDMVRSWVKALLAEGRAPNTINNRLIVVKSFYSWMVDEGEMPLSPAAGVSSPPHRGPDPDVMTDDEFDRLVAVTAGPDPLARRNRAILLVLDSSGCRASELVSMTDEGTDLRGRHLDVEGKGGAWRAVPISAAAAEAVDRYRRVRRQLNGTPARLWWGRRGDLTVKGLARVLAGLGEQAGVPAHAHRFRHRFGHRWLAAGGSEAGLQVAAGWSSPLMPRRYGRALSVERMLDEHRRVFDGRSTTRG